MLNNIRTISLQEACRLGCPINKNLPLLDFPTSVRSFEETGRRFLALYVVVSIAYGLEITKATCWIKKEGLDSVLSNEELSFLSNGMAEVQKNSIQWQVEALWVLAWSLRCHETLDFAISCADNFICMLPDLKAGAPARPFLERLSIRETTELLQACDLAFCLHWGAREAELTGEHIPKAVPISVIVERRRALDWLMSDQNWDDISLDT